MSSSGAAPAGVGDELQASTGVQVIATGPGAGGGTLLQFAVETNTGNTFSVPAAAPQKFQVATAGTYAITVLAEFAANAVGYRKLSVATDAAWDPPYEKLPANPADPTALSVSFTKTCLAGDRISARVAQSSGGNLNITYAAITVVKTG